MCSMLDMTVTAFLFITAVPVTTITSLSMDATQVSLTWKLLSGDIVTLQLRHRDGIQIDLDDQEEWDTLKDNIHPSDRTLTVYHVFDVAKDNAFQLVSYESHQLLPLGQFTGDPAEFLVHAVNEGNPAKASLM